LKRSSAAILLAAATALVIMADAVILVAPRVLADPNSSPSAPAAAVAAAATPSATNPWQPPATYFIPLPSPTAAPPTPSPTPVPKVTPVPYRDTVTNAKAYVKARLGQTGYNCYNAIIMRESKWNPLAGRTTGPYGIPQANPGSKMATFGSNWRTSPLTQVKWGLWYLANRYASACAAWDFWQNWGWY
jgi:Transglycosylase SLT domain